MLWKGLELVGVMRYMIVSPYVVVRLVIITVKFYVQCNSSSVKKINFEIACVIYFENSFKWQASAQMISRWENPINNMCRYIK
jgi:hypothetical protein